MHFGWHWTKWHYLGSSICLEKNNDKLNYVLFGCSIWKVELQEYKPTLGCLSRIFSVIWNMLFIYSSIIYFNKWKHQRLVQEQDVHIIKACIGGPMNILYIRIWLLAGACVILLSLEGMVLGVTSNAIVWSLDMEIE